jgi:hypothetical protein
MSNRFVRVILVAAVLGAPSGGGAERGEGYGPKRRWWRGECQADYWNGPCEVKLESKRGHYKREVKCPGGVGADWHGEWKEEFSDGPCRVKIEAKRDELEEEVQCDER